ncbi:MAG: electron transfer flavoprotein subunit alpha/FixB family protein [Proteobacteria bacterium]|nr:electron transfer flavoprotein subunit alpha/FixB family protein [Pseudomonadota bacterium]
MSEYSTSVLVYIETEENHEIKDVSLEAIASGKRLVQLSKGKLIALVCGKNISQTVDELKYYDIDTLYFADSPDLEIYQPEHYLPIVLDVYEKEKPTGIIFGNTMVAIDLAPRVALKLDTGLVADCVAIDMESDEFVFTKPVYSSNVMAVYEFQAMPFIVTCRTRSCPPAEKKDQVSGEMIELKIEKDTDANQIEFIERKLNETNGLPLSRANIIVAGGRGMGGKEGFDYLNKLCTALGAALGASRPPCDLDWVPAKAQVGLTGEVVAPSLYIAVGISGSFQHLAGMSDSGKIVAINRDPKANIFKVADYGIVGEFEEVLPGFLKQLNAFN